MENKTKNRLKTVAVFAFVAMLMLLAVHRRVIRAERYWLDFMGTGTHVIVLARDDRQAEKCFQAARAEIERIDSLMDYHDPNSELSQINRKAFEQAVKVDRALFEVISSAIGYSEISGGEFDITVGPLVELWSRSEIKPTEEEIQAARAKVGFRKLIIDPNEMTVRFGIEGMKIDLGSIAKGFAIDRAVNALIECGAGGGLVDIGGDLRSFGAAPGGDEYIVGLQNPQAVEDVNEPGLLMRFGIEDMAVATSGDYRRYVEIDGERISHIIDPAATAGAKIYSSVTVIAKDATSADALATMLSLMEPEKAIETVERLDDTEAVLVTKDNQIIKSSGMEKYLR